MRDYEIVYIFSSSLTSDEIGAKLERYHAIIADDGPGEITASVHWGKRHLAYPIRKQKNGYYVVVQFTSGPDPLTELERVLKLEDDVLRYLIVLAERPLPVSEDPPEAPAASPAPSEEPASPKAEAEADPAPADPEPEDGDAEPEPEPQPEPQPDETAADDGETGDPADAREE